MAINDVEFQNFLANWADEINGLINEVETWAGNKNDVNAAFDYTTAQNDLTSALNSFKTSVATVNAL